MSTLADLRNEVLFNSFDAAYGDIADRRLNQAARTIAGRVLWNKTLRPGTVATDGIVTLTDSAEFSRITGVWQATGTLADDSWATLRDQLGDRIVSAGDGATPNGVGASDVVYVVDAGTGGAQRLRVIGAQPGSQVLVEGALIPPAMSGDDDPNPLGDEADDALVLFARAKLFLREDDPEMHASLMQEFEREMRTYGQRLRPVMDGPVQVPGMWGDGHTGVL
jgi:hypothetical protein